jgi:hypothetical protein
MFSSKGPRQVWQGPSGMTGKDGEHMDHSTGKWHKGTRSRVVALAALFLLAAALISLGVFACDEGTVQNVVTDVQNGEVEWEGNGSDNNCPEGGTLHWILTPGGNVTLISGSLHVEFADNTSDDFAGYFQGMNQGAMHFDSVGSAAVVSAIVTFTYTGDPGNQVLTISHSDCNTTTTDGETTTTEEEETTTTVGSETTSTTEDPGTTTTTVGTQTTVTSLSTTTTASSTTTTVASQTTVTSLATTTTAASSTTTTVGSETTSTTVQSETTVTAGRIDTGGGGTAGSGGTVWLVAGLLGSAMIALGWSSARSTRKARGAAKS